MTCGSIRFQYRFSSWTSGSLARPFLYISGSELILTPHATTLGCARYSVICLFCHRQSRHTRFYFRDATVEMFMKQTLAYRKQNLCPEFNVKKEKLTLTRSDGFNIKWYGNALLIRVLRSTLRALLDIVRSIRFAWNYVTCLYLWALEKTSMRSLRNVPYFFLLNH